MWKERSLISGLIAIPLILLVCLLRPRPAVVTVLPLSYNPVLVNNPASERFWVLKAQGTTHFNMILMGDSRVYRGLSPQAMETVLNGYHILNYGFSGGGLNPEMYAAAEGRLDLSSNKKSIVFGVTPLTLTTRAESNDHFVQEMQRPPDYVFLHLYWLPLLNSLQPLTLNEITGALTTENKAPSQEGYYLEFHDDGWVASYTIPENPLSALADYRNIFSQTPVSQRLVQELMDQTKQWSARGIKVYAFRVPSSQAMVNLENQISGFDEAAFARQFQEAGGTWFSIPLEPYHSYDGTHLTKQAAIKLSTDLAQLIMANNK